MPGIASSSPAVLIAHLAAGTTTLRIGSGGVMLPNHSPLAVAEQFGMLEALHPGRIDLGLGRAPGSDGLAAAALRRGRTMDGDDDFPAQLAELVGYFDGSFADVHPFGSIHAVPARGYSPDIWLLGSSDFSAHLAGTLGLPFSFAHHFAAGNTLAAVQTYRAAFRPSRVLERPYLSLGVNVVCAPDDERGAVAGRLGRAGHPAAAPGPPRCVPDARGSGRAPVHADGARDRSRRGPVRTWSARPTSSGQACCELGRRHGRRRADDHHQHPLARRTHRSRTSLVAEVMGLSPTRADDEVSVSR